MNEVTEKLLLADVATRFRLLGYGEAFIHKVTAKYPLYRLLEALDILETLEEEARKEYEQSQK